jgi:DNA-binding MarR family transcriptional regulator
METNAEHAQAKNHSVSSLETHLGYWLRRVSNQVSGKFARALQIRQLSVAEWVSLRLIQQNGKLTPAGLAEMVGMTRGAVSKIVEKLEAKGWVGRTANAGDKRSQWLALTRQGKSLVPKLAELADKNDEHFFKCLEKVEQAALRRLLQKLTDFHRFRKVSVE